jgi:flagellar basal-body rod protein FlgG
VAIQGGGFFQIMQPNGELGLHPQRAVPTGQERQHRQREGYALQPQITLPAAAQQVTIGADGTVSYNLPNQTATQQAGQIQLASFQNPAGLSSLGNGLYTPTDASGDAIVGLPGGSEGMGSLLQGYVEQSNTSIVNEFINLIQAQRGYEANSKVVTAADQMYQLVNNLTR